MAACTPVFNGRWAFAPEADGGSLGLVTGCVRWFTGRDGDGGYRRPRLAMAGLGSPGAPTHAVLPGWRRPGSGVEWIAVSRSPVGIARLHPCLEVFCGGSVPVAVSSLFVNPPFHCLSVPVSGGWGAVRGGVRLGLVRLVDALLGISRRNTAGLEWKTGVVDRTKAAKTPF